jgi:O-antigen/teichoic acid export membrane protein
MSPTVSARKQIAFLGLSQPALQAIGVVASLVLARNLQPRDYGVVAMAMGFTGIFATLSSLGLGEASAQKRDLLEEEASSLFWLNVATGLALSIACICIGPILRWYFGEPEVALVAAWAGVAILLGVLASQHRVRIVRDGRYGSVAVIELLAQLMAASAAILAAVAGYGWRALVVLFVVQGFVRCAGVWLASGWRPSWFRRKSIPRDTVKLGVAIMSGWLLMSLTGAAESAFLGRIAGAHDLGLYSRAMQTARYPVILFVLPAFLPAVHRLGQRQDDRADMGRELLRIQGWLLVLVSLPFGILGGCASDLVPLVMGEQWTPSVLFLHLLLPGIFALALVNLAIWSLTAAASRRRLVQFQALSTLLPAAALACGAAVAGALGTSLAYSVVMLVIVAPVGIIWAAHETGLDPLVLGKSILHVVAIAVATWFAAAGAAWMVASYAPAGRAIRVAAGLSVGSVSWFFAARLWRRSILREVLETVFSTTRLTGSRVADTLMRWCAPEVGELR